LSRSRSPATSVETSWPIRLPRSQDGRDVKLSDLWPSGAEIDVALTAAADVADFASPYAEAKTSEASARLDAAGAALFAWDPASTYVRRPPFASLGKGTRLGLYTAQPILVLGDDITTDHISPAGSSAREAGEYLIARGEPAGPERICLTAGNWEAMLRTSR